MISNVSSWIQPSTRYGCTYWSVCHSNTVNRENVACVYFMCCEHHSQVVTLYLLSMSFLGYKRMRPSSVIKRLFVLRCVMEWTYIAIYCSSQCSTAAVSQVVVCAIPGVECFLANSKKSSPWSSGSGGFLSLSECFFTVCPTLIASFLNISFLFSFLLGHKRPFASITRRQHAL